MNPKSKRVQVVAALLVSDGRILVQRRPEGKTRAALWEFPGGKREANEAPEAALRRECREELGVEVQVGAQVWSTVHRYADLEVALALYRCQFLGSPEAREGQQLQWCAPQALAELPFVAADVPVLALLASGEIAL